MTFSKCQLTSLRRFGMLPLLAGLMLAASGQGARAATIQTGNVTTALGPTFFVDEATTGGSDVTITQPTVASYNRSFAGLLTPNMGPARVTLTGFGFATANAPADNTAATIAVTFTYLGADEAPGGGDDVLIGSASGNYAYVSNGEYVFAFDSPMTAELNITGTRFLIEVAPVNGTNNGKVRFKTAALTFETTAGPKFSVAGFVAPPRVNLAKFQPVTVDSTNGQFLASYVTDGVTGTFNRWQSNGSGPHWARVDFPYPVEIGSAQVFNGTDDSNPQTNFRIQYLSGETWLDVPGALITTNTNIERNIIFTTPVTASSFRIYSGDGSLRVRELALYPPNGGGFPLGTDLTLNLAHQRPALANANTAGNFALLAVDGRVNKDSKWQTSTLGPSYLEIDLIADLKIGSAHLYSGSPGVAPLADFVLKYWDGSAWQDIPGGSVTGNTTTDLVVPFTTPVTTSKVRLEFTNPGTTSVRELCILPANTGNPGYPIGTSIIGAPPITAKADDYTDSFYQITNPAAGRFIAVNNGAPALSQPGLTTAQGQYQILLNHSNGTYRLRNRATGNCLSGAQLSKTTGALIGDEPYSAMPHQDWILDPLDGGAFQLINPWSGLALDIQGGGTAAGTPLVQNTPNGSASQRWTIVYNVNFPKKGIGGTSFGTSANANWAYNWGMTNIHPLPAGALHHPMQWGNFNWTYNSTAASTWKLYPAWRTNSQPLHLMGFNEPDFFSQSGNSLDTETNIEAEFSATRSMEKAVELWPRLMAMDLPLVAPCPANMTGGWLSSFYTQANALGYRTDYTAKHTYGSPDGGSADSLIDGLLEGYTTWGKPMWLTEFSFVDWNENSSWTEEDCYNCLAEFLWRAESLPWLRKYALFVFTEDVDYPMPVNPWSTSVSTGGAPRSNARDIDGNLTAFGKLYASWDNDAVVRQDKTYYFHNKDTRKRLANNTAQTNAGGRNIRVDGSLVHWTFSNAPTSGRYYIVSSLDGRRLSTDGTTVSLVAAGTTGTTVEWTRTATTPAMPGNPDGWHYIGHPASAKRLKMAYNNGTQTATYSMVANTSTGDDVRWRFIVPPPPPVWSGTVGNSWTDAANWMPGILPVNGDVITFNSSSTANLSTMLDQNFNPSGINLSDPSGPVSIGGTQTLTLGSGGIDLSTAAQNLTITAPTILSAAQTWNVNTGRMLSLNGGLTGAFALSISGAGTTSLGGTIDPLTPLTIAAGSTLKTGASSVLASGVTAVNPTLSGTLDINGTSQFINFLSGSGVITNSAVGAASLTLGNNNTGGTLSTPFQNTGGPLTLIKTGTASLILPIANTHSGGFTNNGSGNIIPQNSAAFGSGPIVTNGGTLYASAANFTFTNALTLNAALLRVGGSNSRTLTWDGPVTATGASGIFADGGTSGVTINGSLDITGATFTSTSAAQNNINGPISGVGGNLVAQGNNCVLQLAGTNTYGGTTTIADGSFLRLTATGTVPPSSNITNNGGLTIRNTVSWTHNGTITGDGSATISLNTGTNATLAGNISNITTINVDNAGTDTTINGIISDATNVNILGTVDANGVGATLRLGGANTYTGTTTITRGKLMLAASNVLPNSSAVIIGNATLDAATFTDTAGTLDVTSTATIHLGPGAALAFANSSGILWTGGTLNISGTFVSGVSLKFGTDNTGLTATQLGLISAPGFTTFTLTPTGYLTAFVVTNSYDTWKTQITNGLNGRTQDADGDGLDNLQEFLFGTSPIAGNDSLVSSTTSGNNLVLRWLQRESGATYTLKQSPTMAAGSWTTVVSPSPALDGNQTGAPADYDYHTVTIPTGGGSMFFRTGGVEN